MTETGSHHHAVTPSQAVVFPGKLSPPYAVDSDDPPWGTTSRQPQPPTPLWVRAVPQPRSPRARATQNGQHEICPALAVADGGPRRGGGYCSDAPLPCGFNTGGSDRRHWRGRREGSSSSPLREPLSLVSQGGGGRPLASPSCPLVNSAGVGGIDPLHRLMDGEGPQSQSGTAISKPGAFTDVVPGAAPAPASCCEGSPPRYFVQPLPQEKKKARPYPWRGHRGQEKTERTPGQYDSVYSTDYVDYYAAHPPCQWRDQRDGRGEPFRCHCSFQKDTETLGGRQWNPIF